VAAVPGCTPISEVIPFSIDKTLPFEAQENQSPKVSTEYAFRSQIPASAGMELFQRSICAGILPLVKRTTPHLAEFRKKKGTS
jgi:hypothetical protein